MTDERMALIELIEKQADSDFVRDMLAFAADQFAGPKPEEPFSGLVRPYYDAGSADDMIRGTGTAADVRSRKVRLSASSARVCW